MSDWPRFVQITTFFSALVIIVGTLGNMATIITMCRRWSSLKSTEVFIFILVVIDLILSSAFPVRLLKELDVISFPLLNDSGCQFFIWLILTLNTQSIWVMVSVAVDRFLMIVVKPYSFRRSTKKWKILMINFVIFLLSSTVGVLFFYRVRSESGRCCRVFYISAEEDLIHAASIFAIQFVIPGFILTILYTSMIIKLRKPVGFQDNIRAMQIRKRENWKVMRLFLSIIIIFYVTAFPHQIVYMIYTIHINKVEEVFNYALFSSWALSCLNYCIDPFVYASFYMKDIKQKIRNVFLRHWSPKIEFTEIHPMQAVNTT